MVFFKYYELDKLEQSTAEGNSNYANDGRSKQFRVEKVFQFEFLLQGCDLPDVPGKRGSRATKNVAALLLLLKKKTTTKKRLETYEQA